MNSSYFTKYGLTLFTILTALLLGGCGIFGSNDNDEAEVGDDVFEGARFQLSMDKSEVERGGSFTAIYTVQNTTQHSLEIETQCLEMASIGVYQAGELMNFQGASPTCLTALGFYEIEAEQTFTVEWDVDAFTLNSETGEAPFDTTFVAPGNYTLEVDPHINRINGTEVEVKSQQIEFRVN